MEPMSGCPFHPSTGSAPQMVTRALRGVVRIAGDDGSGGRWSAGFASIGACHCAVTLLGFLFLQHSTGEEG